MSICGYHSPRFSEDIVWLPQWLQPHRPPTVVEQLKDETGVPSPCCENCMFIGDPSQAHQNCQNAMANDGGYSGFILHLSGDEETVASTPMGSNVQPFTLHLSSESAAELSPVGVNNNLQILNSGMCKGPLKGFCADDQEQEVNDVCQNQFGAKDPQNDLPDVCKVASKEINEPLDANKHNNVSGGMVDVRKLRKADVNDAIELSVAASEAMVIAEMMLDDTQSDKLAEAAFEAALHVKEARKQTFVEEQEHACGSSENDLDETDWLAELDEDEMIDAFQDVGLSLVYITCSSQDDTTGDLKQQNSCPSHPPSGTGTHIFGNCSSEKENKRRTSQNADSNDHVSDSLAISQSADLLPIKPTPCYKQGALVKTIPCSRNKESDLQVSVQNSADLHGTLAARVTNYNIHKEGGGVAAQMNVGTKKIVKDLFQDETSFIPESISMEECRSTSGAPSMELIASSRGSFCCKTECYREENQDAEAEVLCCPVVCSSLSLLDPLCSFVPCSISCDEGLHSQAPMYKQSEHNNEGGINQSPECQQNKGKEKEFMYPNKSPKLQAPDGDLGSSSVPLAKSLESNVTSRRRRYSSLRPFSTVAPKSNILGATSTLSADEAVCRQEKLTPVSLNKSMQRVQATKQSVENNVEDGMRIFSKFQKKRYYSQDTSKHQIIEQQVPREVCQSGANLNVDKQHLKRKRVQFSEAKLSSIRTTNSIRMLTKSRFSRSGGRIGETLETSEYIDDKKSLFQGVEFLLTGFHRQKEKEIESLIRKFGGHVLSKVPLFPIDKRKNLADFPSWNPPIVLSPIKVSTAMFLYGCAIDAWMLNPNWLFDSVQVGVLLSPGKYVIRQRKALKYSLAFDHSLHPKCNTLIFDGVGFLVHGKTSFTSKFSNIIKHVGGQVFMSLQGLVQSLKDGCTSHGVILVENEASASRHLSHCGLENDIKTAPASWIIDSLYTGKLIHLKKDRCASFRRIKMPSFQQQPIFVTSQEI